MWWRLQPHVVEAATTCLEAATACGGGTMMSTPQTIRKEANSHVPLDCRM